ncbi:Spore Coat Protein U domain-containing protein [Phyllobacterium sp. OV277]|nr:Spore Coat Protein U domain-containing protein [Phyllobacterium sp. OV277]
MKSADGKNFVPYELCSDRGCKTVWTTPPIQIAQGKPTHDAVTTPIYAKIPKLAAAPPAGVYRDTVIYTVTY